MYSSLLREHISETLYVERTLPVIEEGFTAWIKQKYKTLSDLFRVIAESPSYQFCLLEKDNTRVFIVKTDKKMTVATIVNDVVVNEENKSPSDFKKIKEKYTNDSFDVIESHGGYYRLLVLFLRGGKGRTISTFMLVGLILLLFGLIVFFPALATITLMGVPIGSILGSSLGITISSGIVTKFALGGVLNLTMSSVSRKRMKVADDYLTDIS